MVTIDRTRIESTHAVIAPYLRRTPVLEVSGADFGLPPFPLTLKLELFQHSGSFKARGASRCSRSLRPTPSASRS
jgi:threonine dehydratase